MQLVWAGAVLVVVGLVFCFFGNRIARIALALGGAALGYVLGLIAYAGLSRLLPTATIQLIPSWVVGLVLALLFALSAYAFYAAGVLLLLGSLGWTLGEIVVGLAHVPEGWQLAVCLVCALLLAGIGVAADIPRNLMVIGTALLGAGIAVDGVQVLLGQRIQWLNPSTWGADLQPHLLWMAGFAVLAVLGIVLQRRQPGSASLRAAYPN